MDGAFVDVVDQAALFRGSTCSVHPKLRHSL